ncbi:MAG: AraC family transcriptional regulator, partial [Candidatus Omnitrophota bacterium]
VIEKHLQEKKARQYGPAGENKIERVKDFLLRNLHKKVTLKDASEAVCLSPKYLSRIFSRFAGQGFGEYRISLMVEEAKRLLKQTADTVDQISGRLGYQNAESFIRQFKRSVKATPAEYRKKTRKKKKAGR